MIEEVVPFPKDLAAVFVSALKESYDSSGFILAPVFIYDVLRGVWNMLWRFGGMCWRCLSYMLRR